MWLMNFATSELQKLVVMMANTLCLRNAYEQSSTYWKSADYFFTNPIRKVMTAITRKTKNSIFAIPTALAAMPPKPKTAAINAMTKKTIA